MKASTAFKLWLILLAGATLAGLLAGGDDDEEQLYREGKKAFRDCAACHCVNEPTLAEDEDWLNLNWVTRCIDAGDDTPRVRKVLDVYFRSPKTLRPLLVDENYTPPEGLACGAIKVPSTSGSVYLRAERASIRKGTPPKVRLYWKASENGKTLTVPTGKYRVITYRYYRTTSGEKDALWTLSVTDVNGCADFDVAAGETLDFGFEPAARGDLSAETDEDGVHFSLALRNEKDSTLTISRDGDMCLPRFVVADAAGKEVFSDTFENT